MADVLKANESFFFGFLFFFVFFWRVWSLLSPDAGGHESAPASSVHGDAERRHHRHRHRSDDGRPTPGAGASGQGGGGGGGGGATPAPALEQSRPLSVSAPSVINVEMVQVKFEDEISLHSFADSVESQSQQQRPPDENDRSSTLCACFLRVLLTVVSQIVGRRRSARCEPTASEQEPRHWPKQQQQQHLPQQQWNEEVEQQQQQPIEQQQF